MKKECFTCKKHKELSKFKVNRHFNLKSDLGRCRVCIACEMKKALTTMNIIQFNFETRRFDTITFNSKDELKKYFKTITNENSNIQEKESVRSSCQ